MAKVVHFDKSIEYGEALCGSVVGERDTDDRFTINEANVSCKNCIRSLKAVEPRCIHCQLNEIDHGLGIPFCPDEKSPTGYSPTKLYEPSRTGRTEIYVKAFMYLLMRDFGITERQVEAILLDHISKIKDMDPVFSNAELSARATSFAQYLVVGKYAP